MSTRISTKQLPERERLLNTASNTTNNYSSNKANTPTSSSQKNEEKPKEQDKGSALVIAFLLMLFFQLGNRIFGKLQTVTFIHLNFI